MRRPGPARSTQEALPVVDAVEHVLDVAGRAEQQRAGRLVCGEGLDVLGAQSVQEVQPVDPREFEDVAVAEADDPLTGGEGPRLGDRVAVVPHQSGVDAVLHQDGHQTRFSRAHMCGRSSCSVVARSSAYMRSPSTFP